MVSPRKSGRKRRSSGSKSEQQSTHPIPNAKDATDYAPATLLRIQSTNPTWFNRLEFVNVSDEVIEYLFVNDRIRSKHSKILYPPLAQRRTAKQIREFYWLGTGQCRQVIEKYSTHQIIRPEPPVVEPVKAGNCGGFSLHDILSLKTTKNDVLALVRASEI